MMNTTAEKKHLIDWISNLDDPEMLERIKAIKENSELVSWSEIPEEVKAGIKRGENDADAGHVHSSEEFWKKIKSWREKQHI